MQDEPSKDARENAILPRGGINIGGDVVTIKTADYPDEHRALIRWLFSYAKDNDWSWAEAESHTKISTTTLYRVWQGKYVNSQTGDPIDLTGVCEKISRFKNLADERAFSRRLPFMETSVFRRIEKVCHEALVGQTIALIYGESQIGKTECLKEVRRRNNHGQTTYVLTPAAGGVQSLIKAIALASSISPDTSFEVLRDRVTKFFDDSKLLIIDEIHECFESYHDTARRKTLSVLRQLQEVSHCGMVLCGTNVFRDELERGEYAKSMQQLKKRGIWELQLEDEPTPEDLSLIARYYKLGEPDDDAAQLVKAIAREMGLGKYTKFLARAAQAAAKKQQRFTWDHFVNTVAIATALKAPPTKKRGTE